MRRISRVSDANQLRVGLELLEAAAPGAMERNGRDFAHYWSLIEAGTDSVWCVEDHEGLVAIFLGTPRPNRLLYYDVVLSPGTDPDRVLPDLVDTGAAAAFARGQCRLVSHDPLDGAELYQELGHVPTLRIQINGSSRTVRRQELIRTLDPAHRVLKVEDETRRWAGASFRVDQVDRALQAQLSDPDNQQWAMYMMHRWTHADARSRYVVRGYRRFLRTGMAELREIDPDLTKVSGLNDDAVEMRAGRPGHGLVPATAAKPVTFAHGILDIELDVQLTGDAADVDRIVAGARTLSLEPGKSFAVQCRKGRHTIGGSHSTTSYTIRDVEIRVGMALFAQDEHPVDLKSPDQIVSIYLEGGRALLGLGKPSVAGYHRLWSSAPTVVSRAEHKLAEALEAFDVPLPLDGTVLDLGAAPGGWSYLLAERSLTVYAVDPGDLDPRVAAHPHVTHLRQRVETLHLPSSVDLIVNDMNLDPADSARLMVSTARLLRPRGYSIMTIKLPSAHPTSHVRATHSQLATNYDVLATKHLPHNRQEVTTLLQRKR